MPEAIIFNCENASICSRLARVNGKIVWIEGVLFKKPGCPGVLVLAEEGIDDENFRIGMEIFYNDNPKMRTINGKGKEEGATVS